MGKGELYWPEGIAIDAKDVVYIAESNRVSVFTSTGGFVTSFGSHGRQPGQFDFPQGIAVDHSGVVCVCDHDNNRFKSVCDQSSHYASSIC